MAVKVGLPRRVGGPRHGVPGPGVPGAEAGDRPEDAEGGRGSLGRAAGETCSRVTVCASPQ